jgi:hypothetical protein
LKPVLGGLQRISFGGAPNAGIFSRLEGNMEYKVTARKAAVLETATGYGVCKVAERWF